MTAHPAAATVTPITTAARASRLSSSFSSAAQAKVRIESSASFPAAMNAVSPFATAENTINTANAAAAVRRAGEGSCRRR